MENISYGTDGSKILELHKTGRTDLLNLPSICISLFIKNLSTVTAPHTLGCEIAPLVWILQWYTNLKYMLEAKDSQGKKMLPMSSAYYKYLI